MLPFHNRRYILQQSDKKVWQGEQINRDVENLVATFAIHDREFRDTIVSRYETLIVLLIF